jgi:hypothetical protein
MTVIATDAQRFSSVVKREFDPASKYCRDAVVYNGTATTLNVGAVLGAFIASPAATAVAGSSNTGNGVMGAITMTSAAGLQIGTYTLRIYRAVANAGDFELLGPNGKVIAIGQVATAFNQAGFSFTLADGATDFVVGDTFAITVTGTVKYKLVEATATDGSQVAAAIMIADNLGLSRPTTTTANTDTTFLAITRGPVTVDPTQLSYGTSVNTTTLKNTALSQLAALGILSTTEV